MTGSTEGREGGGVGGEGGGGGVRVVALLLAAGVEVNARTESGYTPLHMCAFNGNYLAIPLLTAAGADKAAVERHHKVQKA
jgi:hypothetical protein